VRFLQHKGTHQGHHDYLRPDWFAASVDAAGHEASRSYGRDRGKRQQVITLATDEFIRRFLLHVLPRSFHRIRHYGLFSSSTHKEAMELARGLLGVAVPIEEPEPEERT
jgi:hypothetical protein